MNSFKKIGLVFGLVVLVSACSNKNSRNYQFMPNMYVPVGYETYGQIDFLPGQMEAMQPVANTIPRGAFPYSLENTPEGKEMSILAISPLDSLKIDENLSVGKELYDIYCAVCHGSKGDGQGNLVKREKILGVPTYADAARNITVGSTYHTIYYGLNSMGSYAGQLNHKERWQVSEYVVKLKQDLTK
ncbi:mono/diheme cytochrome c family protein [Saonia flava]|uniref:Mono/diheme cytochrome c family protein n=1 Tax=Saonia flava TaxID=523696 RepID=A0A846QXL1_9FLAO|nr:cytochrome c [Saonia flava]NJB70963.1 mono/diheme cytochrome c family protein [Saonia flava]